MCVQGAAARAPTPVAHGLPYHPAATLGMQQQAPAPASARPPARPGCGGGCKTGRARCRAAPACGGRRSRSGRAPRLPGLCTRRGPGRGPSPLAGSCARCGGRRMAMPERAVSRVSQKGRQRPERQRPLAKNRRGRAATHEKASARGEGSRRGCKGTAVQAPPLQATSTCLTLCRRRRRGATHRT